MKEKSKFRLYGSTLHESAKTREVPLEKPYETLHTTMVQSEVEDELCPGCIKTEMEEVEFPEHSTGVGRAYLQTDLHYMVRNGLSLPTSVAYVDASDKTDVLTATKRMLTGFINNPKLDESISQPVESTITNETKTE